MFTGIISDVGDILEMTPIGERRRLTVATAYDPASIEVGASIANAGVCLTVVGVERSGARARGSPSTSGRRTLAVTTLGRWRVGERVNLERALRVGDELGGHMVSGHVDGVAEILARRDFDGMAHFRFRAPKDCEKFIAVKGSVALDGTSLTVNAVEGDVFEVLAHPAHARRHDLGRTTGRRLRQSRGRPDGPLRRAADRGRASRRGAASKERSRGDRRKRTFR